MRLRSNRLWAIIVCALSFFCCAGLPARGAPGSPWLVVSDIHYTPFDRDRSPSPYGEDTNDALLSSFLAEVRKVDPNPPVVVIAGDFLAHHFRLDAAASTMTALAKRFDAAFPHAQFVIALGNNDSACGDYLAPVGGPFLAATAKAWAPLVNRRGAAPDFAARFARDGGYAARLPLPGLRIVVANDVFESLRYGASCAQSQNGAAQTLARFRSDLRAAGPRDRNWVLFHIPPGIDAFSTNLTHHLAVVPFLRPNARESLDAAIGDAGDRVVLAIAGHTHKFAYRILSGAGRIPVPMLLVPSISPIFYNGPSFLELTIANDGTVSRVVETSYFAGSWQVAGDLGKLGVRRFSALELASLQARLAHDSALRTAFSHLYSGGGPPEINEGNWRSYWCAAANFSASAFKACTGQGGVSVFTSRALKIALAGVCLLAAGGGAFFFFRRRGRPLRA